MFPYCLLEQAAEQTVEQPIIKDVIALTLSVPQRWRHQMETFSAVLAKCEGNSPFTGESPSQRPVTRSFDVFFDQCLNKRLSKTIETPVIW